MVSPIPYRSFKGVRLGGSYPAVVVMVIAFAVILSKPAVTLFIAGLLYVSSGPVEWLWRWRTGRLLEETGAGESVTEHETRGTTP
jgi:phosphatidylserine synthase